MISTPRGTFGNGGNLKRNSTVFPTLAAVAAGWGRFEVRKAGAALSIGMSIYR